MISVDEMVESGGCPCEVCSSQDEKRDPLDKSNEIRLPSKLINKNFTTLVRIDTELHRLLKIKAAAKKTIIRTLIEGGLAGILEVSHNDY